MYTNRYSLIIISFAIIMFLAPACSATQTPIQTEPVEQTILPATTVQPKTMQTQYPTETPFFTPTPNVIPSLTNTASPTALPAPTEFKLEYRNGIPWCEPQAVVPFFNPEITPTRGEDEGPKNEENSLRSLAEQAGLFIGTAVEPWQFGNEDVAGLLPREFNMITPENAMKWERIHPQPDQYDFEDGDQLVAYAKKNGMKVRGHTLVWDYRLPGWLTEGAYSRDELIYQLCRHIKTVVSHYRGHIYAWDVVNEAFHNEGYLRDTFWQQKIGPEYIPWAFIWASQVDPEVILTYNDHGAEGLSPKSDGIYKLLSELVAKNVPIDAVGLQMHVVLDGPPTPQGLVANMQRLAELGLQVHITEMDVRIQYSSDPLNVKFQKQAKTYRQVFRTCLEQPNCNVFVTWGVSDRYSWIPGFTNNPDYPLLFDLYGHPKSAYYAIRQELEQVLE